MIDAKIEISATSQQEEAARTKLEQKLHHRIASLTPAERFFLHSLLVDDVAEYNLSAAALPEPKTGFSNNRVHSFEQAANVLDDEVLFSVPHPLVENQNVPDERTENQKISKSANTGDEKLSSGLHNRIPSKIRDLWLAHEDGVNPQTLLTHSSIHHGHPSTPRLTSSSKGRTCQQEDFGVRDSFESFNELASDVEIRKESKSDVDSAYSSWDDDLIRDHYSGWEILKDEYAKDLGFDYNRTESVAEVLSGGDAKQNAFQILGTSADDHSAQPHVLSPPLMDALMSHVPSSLRGQNYWLKFSLMRDGASLETLKMYSRASPYTILAIETHQGEVFGCFTSQPWRNRFGYYGTAPAFVWKMKRSRQTKCYSIFDQAKLESEIDVYHAASPGQLLQICRHDALAIGGDERAPCVDDFENLHAAVRATDKMGFALALEDDLMIGTTSPSPSFGSPSLCGPGDRTQTFQVVNLEIWTFTPCFSVSVAEKLEMSKFFIEESVHRFSDENPPPESFSSRDLDQKRFYVRAGHDQESDERRQSWEHTNFMLGAGQRGLGRTPRFS